MRHLICALLSVAVIADVQGQMRKIDFDQETAGQPPKGFVFGYTRKAGARGRWMR